ncbi:C-GCAxxG-C-C family protein [Desulfogranum japonicum]|uniref:C-GCAxxG-C-C family protein n=1 Tax=Desulfogranum japonicum TaxID=231447 RepID=UPI0003FF6300|nr:C-GCAxxG-C-C family protein [Desulfogranum japonicum]
MNQQKLSTQSEGLSRRQWLKGAGVLASCATMANLGNVLPHAHAATTGNMEQWPWPYVKLDPTTTAELAYREWYRIYCGGAVISSVFTQLREKVGEPYTSFPIDAFMFLEGGCASWGTLCGSNAGACIVANLILGPRLLDEEAMGHRISTEILEWYCNASMPVFKPKQPRIKGEIPKTIAESPLCHVSVGKWMAISEKPINSPERKDRCARTAASVSYRLVELLNSWKEDEFEFMEEGNFSPLSDHGINAQPNCAECHGGGVPEAPEMRKPKA